MARTIEEELRERGRILLQTEGVSMKPMLQPRKSSIVVEPKRGKLKKNDVVIFKRPDGSYVLHRVVKVHAGQYMIRGDNCVENELVPEEWVIGRLTGFFPDESARFVSCGNRLYKGYVALLPVRYLLKKIRAFAARRVKKLLRVKQR